ncbi:MAG: methyl-accepting chemotaxis protein [Solibacillus sp.]
MGIRSIGSKLTLTVIALLVVTCGALGALSYINSKSAIEEKVKTTVEWKAQDVSKYIEEFVRRTNGEIESIAEQPAIKSMDLQQQFSYLNERLEKSADYVGFGIVDANGVSHYSDHTTADLADRDYIKEAFNGETAMSDILISRVTNEPVIMIATPINTATGEKALLLARIDGYFLSNVMTDIRVGDKGYAVIINEDGTIQGHPDKQFVKDQVNFITQAEESGQQTGESLAMKEMIQSENGYYEYKDSDGENRLMAYHTLTTGWKMGVIAQENEMFSSLSKLLRSLLLSTVAMIILGAFIAFWIGRSISKPVGQLVSVSENLAKGDFTRLPSEKGRNRGDELGVLARSLTNMVTNMKEMIVKVEKNAENVSEGSCDLMGDVNEVTKKAAVISQAIDQIDEGSTTQAMMAEESATAMEQMALGIQNVAEVANAVAAHTQFIEQKVREGHGAVHDSIQQMDDIQKGTALEIEVIYQLQKESEEIGAISKMITDISDQTNLLALNASIEAARAGDHGKGFAVVADEVRKLSEQTANSAAQINVLIQKVQSFTVQAVNAAESGEQNVEKGLQSITLLEQRFEEIVNAVEKITHEIEQLSGSAQQMSANTEEVSASMEEMSATVKEASAHIHQVSDGANSQKDSVESMAKQANALSEMARELSVAVSQFKL